MPWRAAGAGVNPDLTAGSKDNIRIKAKKKPLLSGAESFQGFQETFVSGLDLTLEGCTQHYICTVIVSKSFLIHRVVPQGRPREFSPCW